MNKIKVKNSKLIYKSHVKRNNLKKYAVLCRKACKNVVDKRENR